MASYSHTKYSHIRHNPEIIYYDMTARNFDSPNTESEIELRFQDTRDSPIVNNASDYELSIIRFQVDTFSEMLPILLFQVQRNQNDRNRGIYSVTLEHDDGFGGITTGQPEYLEWVPQVKNSSLPQPPSFNDNGLQSFSNYYYCYNFQWFINLVNRALFTAMDKLKALVAPVLNNVEEPFLVWNDDQTATLYARVSHFDIDVFPQVRIYFNRSLYSLFNSFPSIKFGIQNSNNKFYQILMNTYNGANVVNLPNFGIENLIFNKQEYSTIQQWSPVSSVIFTSSTLPIIPNQLSNPSIYVDQQQIQLSSTYNNFANIITDISSDELCFKPDLLYNPSAEYRMIDLQNDQPINQVTIEVSWRSKLGQIYPVTLPPNGSCSLKLMFRKKKLIK